MPIFLHNSLSRTKEEFKPLDPPQANIYTCGVTVYDESHIGHARSLYIFDLIRRYLQYRGFKVKFVRNITDIDDKIINRANELKVDWQELVKKYIARYYEDLAALGIQKGDAEPRATENILEMIKYISGLIEKGYAYQAGNDVYFDVRKFSGYGKLSGQSIDQMESGARIEPSESKRDPLDFALWKGSKVGEPSWDSPWGKGRPGWHIECSVMSQKFLDTQTLDIHAGGRDLIFPHHENEIAQAEALTGKPFAKYWIHHGLLTINGQKMAKSLGNFVTIKDVLSKYPADILKIFFLQAHYSSPIDFSWEKMEEAKKAYERILIMIDKIDEIFKDSDSVKKAVIEKESMRNNQFEYMRSRFVEAMDDDFNTPQALAVLQGLITDTNIVMMKYPQITNKEISLQQLYFSRYILLKEITDIFGLSLKRTDLNIFVYNKIVSDDEIGLKIQERNKARRNKDYALSDKIRKDLEGKGIILEDRKDGKTTWRRKL